MKKKGIASSSTTGPAGMCYQDGLLASSLPARRLPPIILGFWRVERPCQSDDFRAGNKPGDSAKTHAERILGDRRSAAQLVVILGRALEGLEDAPPSCRYFRWPTMPEHLDSSRKKKKNPP